MCFKKKNKFPGTFREITLNEYNPSDPIEQPRRLRKGTREIGTEYKKFPKNMTKTAKYTYLSIFPLFLINHFSKYTNFYFLIMTILWLIPSISPFSISSVITPISFITLVSFFRELFEDIARHKSDR